MTNFKTGTFSAAPSRTAALTAAVTALCAMAAPAAADGPIGVPSYSMGNPSYGISNPANGMQGPAYGMLAPAHGHMQSDVAMSMTVDVDRTHVLRLDRPAAAVVVGNPSIADIAVHTTDTILVLGRNYGSTNIIALDAVGNIMSETTVRVGDSPTEARLRVYEGAASRKTFDCHGSDCLPTPMVGDDPEFRVLNTNQGFQQITDSVVSDASRDAASAAGPFSPRPTISSPGLTGLSGSSAPTFTPAAPSQPFTPAGPAPDFNDLPSESAN